MRIAIHLRSKVDVKEESGITQVVQENNAAKAINCELKSGVTRPTSLKTCIPKNAKIEKNNTAILEF
jgi:hypothetical protein